MKYYKVLIVEDDRFVARQLSTYFTNQNHQVVGMADNAEDAIALAQEHQPDLMSVR